MAWNPALDCVARRKRVWPLFSGRGLDIGPLDKPFFGFLPGHDRVVETVDRWDPAEMGKLFPELSGPGIPPPTHLHDVSLHGLSFAPDNRYDFVICSHVLEHVANPLWLIQECHRVLKPGGLLYLAVPDGRTGYDRGRPLTTYTELSDLFVRRATTIADHQVLAYLRSPRICRGWVRQALKRNAVTPAMLDHERNRSFHVHVWSSRSFVQHVGRFAIEAGLDWELVDLQVWENSGCESMILLRKSGLGTCREGFSQALDRLMERRLGQGGENWWVGVRVLVNILAWKLAVLGRS